MPYLLLQIKLRAKSGTKLLAMNITLEVNKRVGWKIQRQEEAICDAITLLTSDYTIEDLDGLDGKLGLKDNIKDRVDNLISPSHTERLYFTKFVYN